MRVKIPNVELHKNPSDGSVTVPCGHATGKGWWDL